MGSLSSLTGLPPTIVVTWLFIVGLHVAGLVVPFAVTRGKDLGDYYLKVRSWAVVAGGCMLAVGLGRWAAVPFFALVSLAALREYFALVPVRIHRVLQVFGYVAVVGQFALVGLQQGAALWAIPVVVALAVPILGMMFGSLETYLFEVGELHFGILFAGWSPSFVAALVVAGEQANPVGGRAGHVSLLLFLVMVNDALQFVWGRLLGRHRLVPRLSPKKTWEGLVGGVLSTAGLSALFAPMITPLARGPAFGIGLAIGLAGFFGDITISAVKRHAGVKDTGTALPGMGGIFDRIDSLIYAAPLYYVLVVAMP